MGGHVTKGRDGHLYVLGQQGSDLAITRVLPDGSVRSETTLDSGSSSDTVAAIAASPDGAVYALGSYQPQIVNRRDFSLFRVEEPGSACPPDLTGEGDVNTNDFFRFLSLYQAGDPAADFVGDGAINTNDFFAFLAAYQAGC